MTVSAGRGARKRNYSRIWSWSRRSGRRYIDRRQVPAAGLAVQRAFAKDLADGAFGIAVRAKSDHEQNSKPKGNVYLPKFPASIRRLRAYFAGAGSRREPECPQARRRHYRRT